MIDIRSFRDIVRLFYIFRRQFFIALWVTVALIVLGAFFWTPKYASEARLLVKPGRENLTVPIDVTDRATYAPQSSQRDPIIDEEKMLTGRPVVTQVARLYLPELSLPAEAPPGFKNALKYHVKKTVNAVRDALRSFTVMLGLSEVQSEEDRLASKLEDAFTVTHGPGSSVMDLRFTWGDAVLAQRIMKTWIKVYTDERTTVLGRKTLVVFYDNKVRDTDQQIESIKGQLRSRLTQINGISAEERLTAITKRLNELRTRQSELVAERAALQESAAYAAGRAKGIAKETVAERDVGYGPAWLALSNQLAELKRQRAEALRIFKDGAPAILSLNESIAALEVQLKAEDRPMQRGEKRTPSELSTLLAKNELEKSVRLREIDSLSAAFTKEHDALIQARQEVLSKEPELARLEQALTVAERSRLLYLDSLEKARIDQALDDNRINNIAVIEDATLNPSRASPKSLVLLILALPAGAIVGLLVLYLCSVMDQRIHDGGRLEARFGVPLWSTIKDIAGDAPDNDFHASLHRIYGTLPLDGVADKGLTVGLTSSRSGEGVSFITQRLRAVLQAQGLTVVIDPPSGKAQPGEVALLEASNLLSNRQAFLALGKADLIVLVVEARASVIPVVDNALGVLRTAFRKVDGVILNRRRFEVPSRVMRFFQS